MKFQYFVFFLSLTFLCNCTPKSNNSEFINKVTGRYLYNTDEVVEAYFKENELYLIWRGAKNIKPIKLENNIFYVKEMNEKIQFLTNPDNQKEYMVLVPKEENSIIKYNYRKLFFHLFWFNHYPPMLALIWWFSKICSISCISLSLDVLKEKNAFLSDSESESESENFVGSNENICKGHENLMKYIKSDKKENFIRILTEAKMDESPSVAPNGNMVIYGITEEDQSMLAGFSLSGASFKLPASQGEVREPAWSDFLR